MVRQFGAPKGAQAVWQTGSAGQEPSGFIYAFLRQTSGNPPASGDDRDMNVVADTATPGVFQYIVPENRIVKLARINIGIVDGGIRWNEFAGLGAPLDNGIQLQTMFADGNPSLDFLEGEAIQTNQDFEALAGVDAVVALAAGDDLMPIRFSFFKAGTEIVLKENESLRMLIRDDLSGMTEMRAMVQGSFVK